MSALRSRSLATPLLLTAVGLTACGAEAPASSGVADDRPYAVSTRASFAPRQRISRGETIRITVTNEETRRALPNVAVVLGGLERSLDTEDNGLGAVADPGRPVWIVDVPPAGAASESEETFALGRLPAGRSRTFTWKVTPAVAGRHELRWRAFAALDRQTAVRAVDGSSTHGAFRVRVGG